jgi:hypothetical protein
MFVIVQIFSWKRFKRKKVKKSLRYKNIVVVRNANTVIWFAYCRVPMLVRKMTGEWSEHLILRLLKILIDKLYQKDDIRVWYYH